jgi:hypothetical protein
MEAFLERWFRHSQFTLGLPLLDLLNLENVPDY